MNMDSSSNRPRSLRIVRGLHRVDVIAEPSGKTMAMFNRDEWRDLTELIGAIEGSRAPSASFDAACGIPAGLCKP